MQRRFIGELKENLKALKQEFTGADIYNGEHIVTGKQIGRAHV